MLTVAVNLLLLALLGYAAWQMPDAVQRTLPFGVRVTAEQADNPAIARVRRDYRTLLLAVFAVSIAASLLLREASTAWAETSPIAILLVLSYLDYYAAHRRLQGVKAREGWYRGQHEAYIADTGLREAPDRFPGGFVWISLSIIVLTVIIGIVRYPALPLTLVTHYGANGQPNGFMHKSIVSAFLPVAMQIGLTVLMSVIALVTLHTRQELDPADPEGSAIRHSAFRGTVSRLVLILSAFPNVTMLLTALSTWGLIPITRDPGLEVLVPLPTILGAAYAVAASLRIGQGGSRIAAASGAPTGYVNRDDDRYWVGGGMYFNRSDSAIFVQKRFGVGWTLNFGHPIALLFIVVLIGAVVLIERVARHAH